MAGEEITALHAGLLPGFEGHIDLLVILHDLRVGVVTVNVVTQWFGQHHGVSFDVKAIEQVVLVVPRRVDVPAQAGRQGEPAIDAPVVLEVKAVVLLVEFHDAAREIHIVCGGFAEKEVGGVETGIADGGR